MYRLEKFFIVTKETLTKNVVKNRIENDWQERIKIRCSEIIYEMYSFNLLVVFV